MFKHFRAVSTTVSFACLSACTNGASSTGSSVVPQTVHAATVANASVPATLESVQVVSAAAFANSVGINTHWNYPIYSNAFATTSGLLVSLGVRHIRDGFVSNPASAAVYFGYLQRLQSSGVHATMLTAMNMPVTTIAQNVQAVPNFTEAIEAPNEYDFSGDPLWAAHLAAYQQTLYQGVKANAQLSALKVMGPAFGWASSYGKFGNQSAYMDQGNMHNYFSGYNPGTTGYGGGGYGSVYGTIAYNLGAAAQASGTKPVVSTETGYCTIANTRNAVSPEIESKYIPRMYLEDWLAHVPRTIQYELIDEGGSGCNGTFGLLTSSLAPKPGYFALKNLLATVNDAGANFSPTSLPFALTTPVATVHRLLMQKSNGSYVLALWNEVPSWNVNNGTGTPITPIPVSVTVQLAAAPASSQLGSISDDGSLQTGTPVWQDGNAAITIDDHVTLLTFTL